MNEENIAMEEFQPEEMDDTEVLAHIRARHVGREVKASDIITMQCILCILLAILAIVLNLLMPQFSGRMVEIYKTESNSPGETNEALASIVSKITEFMNKTPNDRV